MLHKTSKKEKHIQPFERLARHVIIRGWLDTIGHGVFTSYIPKSVLKKEAEEWIGSKDYYYWSDVAGLEPCWIEKLYTRFKTAYNNGVWNKENPHSTLMHLFEVI